MRASNKSIQQMLLSVVFFMVGHSAVKWLPHIPFYQLSFLRAAITVTICLMVLRFKKLSWKGNNLPLLLIRGVAGTIAVLGYFYALQHMPLASAVAIQFLSPIFTLIVAHFFLKERATFSQALCFFVAFIGVLMIKGFDPRISNLALAASFISVVASGFAYNFVRMLRHSDVEMVVVLYFPLVTLPLVAPVALYNWVWPSPRDWLFILAVGVLTQLAQVLMTLAYHKERAADIAIYNYLGIIIAFVIGYIFFGETFSTMSLVGMAIILLSVIVSTRLK